MVPKDFPPKCKIQKLSHGKFQSIIIHSAEMKDLQMMLLNNCPAKHCTDHKQTMMIESGFKIYLFVFSHYFCVILHDTLCNNCYFFISCNLLMMSTVTFIVRFSLHHLWIISNLASSSNKKRKRNQSKITKEKTTLIGDSEMESGEEVHDRSSLSHSKQ